MPNPEKRPRDAAAQPQPEGPRKQHGDRLDDHIPRDPGRLDAERTAESPERGIERGDDRSTLGG